MRLRPRLPFFPMTTVVRGHPIPQDVFAASVKPPRWVAGLFNQPDIELREGDDVAFCNASNVALAMARIRGAQAMDAHQLRDGVIAAYGTIAARLAASEALRWS